MTFSAYEPLRYRVGIDVGTHSVGFCAIEVDDADNPVTILNSVVYVHDSGVDPSAQKQAQTRLAVSGVKRRTRRMFRVRKQRLAALDRWIEGQGWPLVDLESEANPFFPWLARVELARGYIDDPVKKKRYLSAALRHIARHRGWRNPYSKTRSLYFGEPSSNLMTAFASRVEAATGRKFSEDVTAAELVAALGMTNKVKLRGPVGELGGKLMQSDNANEIRRIFETQGLSEQQFREAVDQVFSAKSPRGSSADRAGRDALPGQEGKRRALKADEAFQHFRIVATLMNLFVEDTGSQKRKLTREELDRAASFLMYQTSPKEVPTWADVAKVLGVQPEKLGGTAADGPDGEPRAARPPVNVTDLHVKQLGLAPLTKWWKQADPLLRSVFVTELSNAGEDSPSDEALEEVNGFLERLTDAEMEKLSELTLPAGRAAYSLDSLERLTARMREQACNLHEARTVEFGVTDDWRPPADQIAHPVGNPAVDRVTKIVSRWLGASERKWGPPTAVNVEHVRSALGSESMARELKRQNDARSKRNEQIFAIMSQQMGIKSKFRRSDLTRYLAYQRQNGKCAYCDTPIAFEGFEMDHIVPRAGQGGARSIRSNLVAVCGPCNLSKSNQTFAQWVSGKNPRNIDKDEVVGRVRHWIADPEVTVREHKKFCAEVVQRLQKKTEDEAIDDRAMESVAWMANELHLRIEHHFRSRGSDTTVNVFRGAVTAEGRRASGFENRVNLLGEKGKSRLDRRHHAMDAATIALMRPSVAKTLSQRANLRLAQQVAQTQETWKAFVPEDRAQRIIYANWLEQMLILAELFNNALANDAIPVMQNLRLRLGSSRVHEDKVQKLVRKVLSSEFTSEEIDRAASPALWTALSRCPDYDQYSGLPENPDRHITVKGKHLGPLDPVELFGTGAAAIAVRGGYAELGAAVHHARIYRINGKKPSYAMLRVYNIDLARHQSEDLFAVPLPPNSISVRTADKKLRKALRAGSAEYLNWLVVGDELELDTSAFTTGHIGGFMAEFPSITRWRIDGFYTDIQLRLRPVLLSAEGLREPSDSVKKVVDRPGWIAAVNVALSAPSLRVIRRTALGAPRTYSEAGLPVCWSLEG